MNGAETGFPVMHVLGVRVHMLKMTGALSKLESWIQDRAKCHYMVASGMHAVMEAHKNKEFKNVLNSADLFVPDGISLVWTGRMRGFPVKKRVCGTDIMWDFMSISEREGYSNFFYGDTDETLQLLKENLKSHFPNLKIAGAHSPPFRSLTPKEKEEEIQLINESGADVVWVGLGLPKQEQWMYKRRSHLTVPALVGVGAAFKFHSGRVNRAPKWIGEHGLEWLWRFIQEPKRVWRRVFIDIPKFVLLVNLETLGLKKFHTQGEPVPDSPPDNPGGTRDGK